ncbi:peptidase S8/S53 domain-containing protein, partial [Syncephalis pseudoplumigaleata]
FKGFSGKWSSDMVRELQRSHQVEYVEPQRILRVAGEQATSPSSWGLARISPSSHAHPDGAGAGIDIWIIDTGIMTAHPEFEGRARMSANFVAGEDTADLHGHGTHVAGIAGSMTYGVAKKASLIGVKVLDGQGAGSEADVIAGIQHAVQTARRGKSVINLSMSGTKSRAIDDAVNAAVAAGFPLVVAAGN